MSRTGWGELAGDEKPLHSGEPPSLSPEGLQRQWKDVLVLLSVVPKGNDRAEV